MSMDKIVITGGPRGGKSVVLRAIEESFPEEVVVVPEVATMLLSSGFPTPESHLTWSAEWRDLFQRTIAEVQPRHEMAWELVAREREAKLLVCDRGLLDGAAYTPGGRHEFARRHGVDLNDATGRYNAVVHLESTAVGEPEAYEAERTAGNEVRFEDVEEAAKLDQVTWDVWRDHPGARRLECLRGLEGKRNAVLSLVRAFMS